MAENQIEMTQEEFLELQNDDNRRRKIMLTSALVALLFLYGANFIIGTFDKEYYNYYCLDGQSFASTQIGTVADLEQVEITYNGDTLQIQDPAICQDLYEFTAELTSEVAPLESTPEPQLTAKFYFKNHNVAIITLPTLTNKSGEEKSVIYDGNVAADFWNIANQK